MSIKPTVGSPVIPHLDTEYLIMDSREVGGKWIYLWEWWQFGTRFECWIPESELEGSDDMGQGVGRA